MASITFKCPNCSQKLSADKTLSESVTLCPVCSQTIRIPEFHLYPAMKIGDFVLKQRLGIGGMGEVWLAEQSSMQRLTALKILSPSLSGNQEFCTRFQYEAKNSGKLSHPNIVTAFYAGVEDEIHYLAMAYIDGITLDDALEARKTIPENEALQIVQEVAEALRYAWDSFKIIHRDIKPSNIMLCNDGAVKLLDLGISKSLTDHDTVTRTGIFVGTPYYISPEQAKNDPSTDCRTDIYSLGAVLYHMLTGNVPYDATTPMGVIARHLTDPLPDIRTRNAQISEPVRLLIEKMMQKKKDDRFADWNETVAAIKKIRHLKNTAPWRRWSSQVNRRHLLPLLLVAAVIITTLTLVSLVIKMARDNNTPPTPTAQNGTENDLEVFTPVSSAEERSGAKSTPQLQPPPPITNSGEVKQTVSTTAGKGIVEKPAPTDSPRQRPAANKRLLAAGTPDIQQMRRYLGLSPEQVDSVVEILQHSRNRIMQLRAKLPYADVSYREKIHQDLQKIRQDTARQIKELLTDEQRQKFQDLEKVRRKLMDGPTP